MITSFVMSCVVLYSAIVTILYAAKQSAVFYTGGRVSSKIEQTHFFHLNYTYPTASL